ncbi:hypothetical protein QTP70_031428 [Hemibagrus guttatus]|uniref:Uncharacterized protein n=1 Tax=Hemibagrus guttatus TaxID=175788 RepID=A0AAE0R9K1_9TELE|nr:hypothetical protein QTP70_031428 [Hemibagrus guttatus]
MTEQRRRHNLKDSTLKFVTRPDDITPPPKCLYIHTALDDDPNTQRLEMSCGHAVTPESLTAYCRSLLDQAIFLY